VEKFRSGGVWHGNDGALPDGGVFLQDMLDFAELDPETAQLDLPILPSDEDERTVGLISDEIARFVHAATGRSTEPRYNPTPLPRMNRPQYRWTPDRGPG